MIISSVSVFVFGIWVLLVALRSGHSWGGLTMAVALMIILISIGVTGVVVGIRRLRWSRRTGR